MVRHRDCLLPLLVLFLFGFLAIPISLISQDLFRMAFAQADVDRHLTLNMPMSHYKNNEEIVIEGSARPFLESEPINIAVFRPDGSAILEDAITPLKGPVFDGIANAEYKYTFLVTEEAQVQGHYNIILNYGEQQVNATFYYDNLLPEPLESPYKLKWKGQEHDIDFRLDGSVKVDDIRASFSSWLGPTIFVLLDRPGGQGAESMEITVPLTLINKVFGYAISPTYTDDYRVPMYVTTYNLITATPSDERADAGIGYDEPQFLKPKTEKGCESVTWEFDVPNGAVRIDLSLNGWGFIPEAYPEPVEDSKYPFRGMVTSNDGQSFMLDIFTNAKTCAFDFIEEEKRIHIDIATPGIESAGYLLINVPDRLLGGNYTVLVDRERIDSFKVLGSSNEYVRFTNTTEQINAIEIEYDKNARSIYIVGTTAIPEFSSSVGAATVGGVSIAIVLLTSRSLKIRMRK